MNRKFLLMFVSIVALLAGCATPDSKTRISSGVTAYQFNDPASKYMARPTFATVLEYSDRKLLDLTMSEYGEKTSHVVFDQAFVDDYVALINKYLEWQEIALSRGDMIEKNIGKAKDKLIFDFYSANANNHYLVIATDMDFVRMWEMVFPKEEAVRLKALLLKFKANNFSKVDTDSLYN